MTTISILGNKVPLVALEFSYAKNGELVPKSSLHEAYAAAFSDGDGSGNTYSNEEYFFSSGAKNVNVLISSLLPEKDYRFSKDAAARKNGILNLCLHDETVEKVETRYEGNIKIVSCATCLALLKKVTYEEDNEGNVTKFGQFFLGTPLNCGDSFTNVPKKLESKEEVVVEGTQVPLIHAAYAVHVVNSDGKDILTFTNEDEAIQAVLEQGDGRLEYLKNRLYQYISTTISYQIEITETILVVEGVLSDSVNACKGTLDKQAFCSHETQDMEVHFLDCGDVTGKEIEYVSFVCVDCQKVLNSRYYIDACQQVYSKELMARTEEQEKCFHNDTFEKVTPQDHLECLNCDTNVTTYCVKCDAMLYTQVASYEFELISYEFKISATYLF